VHVLSSMFLYRHGLLHVLFCRKSVSVLYKLQQSVKPMGRPRGALLCCHCYVAPSFTAFQSTVRFVALLRGPETGSESYLHAPGSQHHNSNVEVVAAAECFCYSLLNPSFVCPVTYEVVSRTFRTGHPERELQMVQLSATRCSYIAIL
jgi:hypothetical protein